MASAAAASSSARCVPNEAVSGDTARAPRRDGRRFRAPGRAPRASRLLELRGCFICERLCVRLRSIRATRASKSLSARALPMGRIRGGLREKLPCIARVLASSRVAANWSSSQNEKSTDSHRRKRAGTQRASFVAPCRLRHTMPQRSRRAVRFVVSLPS